MVWSPPIPGVITYRTYRRDRDTEVEVSKISRANIREATDRQGSGFPDDIFGLTPTPMVQPPDPPHFQFPDVPYYLIPGIFKFLEFIWNGVPSR